ncbi:MAG: LCP family protein [Clostridia bacterium]|nr:LCP family protein [Clostridia bacterium]
MKMKYVLTMILVFAALMSAEQKGMAEVISRNPLLTPTVIEEYTQTEDEFTNILLLGIDYGGDIFTGSGNKRKLEDCHTDGVIVVSLNRTKNELNLVSVPRDSLTYVPGIRGIYKLNAAINCGESIEQGCELACDAVSWHLGGIKIDKYVAVDATALAALGDAIGGIQNFKVDTGFQGKHRWYEAGQTYDLDGVEMMYYMRVRQRATVDYTDIGRTKRQRRMLSAVFNKIKSNPALLLNVMKAYQSGEINVFTNIDLMDLMTLATTTLSLDLEGVNSHVLTGEYKTFMKNFTFNDQAHRQEVIKTVYGVDVPQKQHVSYAYTRWLTEAGLTTAKYINMARDVIAHCKTKDNLTQAQQDAFAALDAATDACILAFDQAADTMASDDTKAMVDARNAMKPTVEKAARLFRYPTPIKWGRNEYWYREQMINEVSLNWN